MDQQTDSQMIIKFAQKRGINVIRQGKGYLLQIPIYNETKGNRVSELPYMVESVDDIFTIADRIWKNKNYRKNVNAQQT